MCNGKGTRIERIAPGVHEIGRCTCHQCKNYRKSSEERMNAFDERFKAACEKYGVKV